MKMIDKREDSSCIKDRAERALVTSISLENVDQCMKQLEVQRLQAQSKINSSFNELHSFLVAREKQLLRQVDVLHDHLLLCMQSQNSVQGNSLSSDNSDVALEMEVQNNSSHENASSKIKVSPGINVLLDTQDMQNQIHTFGKVEMTEADLMQLSEDNEAFNFPYRVQNYQETTKDHMILYKPLDAVKNTLKSPMSADHPYCKGDVGKAIGEVKPFLSHCENKAKSDCSQSSHLSLPMILNKDINEPTDELKILQEEAKTNDDKDFKVKDGLKQLSEESPDDVKHWIREILQETNPEPSSNDSGRFDLFTVLTCSRETVSDCTAKHNITAESSQKTVLLEDRMECFPVEAEAEGCYLVK